MPEDKNRSYDLNVDPELAKMMPLPKMREDEKKDQPETDAAAAQDTRSADQIPEIDPETGDAVERSELKSYPLEVDPELAQMMPKPQLRDEFMFREAERKKEEVITPAEVAPPAPEKNPIPAALRQARSLSKDELMKSAISHVPKEATLELMEEVKRKRHELAMNHYGPKTQLGIPRYIEAVLAYALFFFIGALLLLVEKDDEFVRFHAKQAVIVFTPLFFIWIIARYVPFPSHDLIAPIADMAISGIAMLLMFTAYTGKKFSLPFVRYFMSRMK